MAWFFEVPGRPAYSRPVGLGFCPFFMILGTLVPATRTHPKLVALVRNKKNMYGTWCKAHVIPEKLMDKMENSRQHPPKLKLLLVLEQS